MNDNYGNSNFQTIALDFGQVEVGVTEIKSIKIVNHSSNKQNYILRKDPLSNPLDCAFNAVEYTWSLMPCDSYVCDISYRPTLPNRKYTDYFCITDTNNCCYKIVLQGTSLGSQVTASTTQLIISYDKTGDRNQKSFKLTNNAKTSAKFTFDVDATQCPFKINETSGILKASSSKCFTVSFESTNFGMFKYHLACLVQYQAPLIIELYAVQNDDSFSNREHVFPAKIQMLEVSDGLNNFERYLRDTTDVVRSDPPPISLSQNSMDFGFAQVGEESYGQRTPQTICFTNDRMFNLFIVWDKDVSSTFSIRPQEAKVRGNQSIIFEVRFDPAEKKKLYSRELLARAFRLPCCETTVTDIETLQKNIIPDYVSLRLIGHTYACNYNNCVPQYEVPETVIMPACIPTVPVYTTFVIKNFGPQPLMFCFIPPETSHYNVKPIMGLIEQKEEHQIIVVQLFPEAVNDNSYVERWAVRLNGNPEYEIYIDFQGYAEQVKLDFGVDNCVDLYPVHLGCQHTQLVPVRNPTRHNIEFKYSICDIPRELNIREISGIIHPNETVYQNWTFAPRQLGDSRFVIPCSARTEMSKRSTLLNIDVTGKCAEGSLIACPEELNFGERAYGEVCESEFKIFNFSSVTINFLLIVRPSKTLELMNLPENDVQISPTLGVIHPGKGEKIKIIINPKQAGFYELSIEYCIRSHPAAETGVQIFPPKAICTVNCMCYLPTIQIKDLLYRVDSNKQISKISLWKSLCIDDLNSALKNLLPYQETTVEMIIPFFHFEENERLLIKLLVKNTKKSEISFTIKQQTTCVCNEKNIKIRPRKKSLLNDDCLYCVHDKSCKIYPKQMKLLAAQTGIITIEILHDTLLTSGIFWDMNIEEERYVVINIKLENRLILSGEFLKFKHFNLKQRSIRYQTVWIYNDGEREATYTVDTQNMTAINKKNYRIIFTCLNPDGIVKGCSQHPIIFGCSPKLFGKFQTSVLIKVGDIVSKLYLEAESTRTGEEIDNCPFSDTFSVSEVEVYFNHDIVIASPISLHGKTAKLFMVHNHNLQDVLQYRWTNCEITGLAKVTVEPVSGLIQPQSLLTFVAEISIGSYECCLDIDIFCDFLNVSERSLAEKKKAETDRVQKELKKVFTITEKGVLPPEKPTFDEIKKPSTFCKTLTLRIQTFDSENADGKFDLNWELKNAPNSEIQANIIASNCHEAVPANIVGMSSHIFQNIIWDIINSDSFSKTLKEDLKGVQDLKYYQLPVDIAARKRESGRMNVVVPKRHTEDILHKMLGVITLEEFNFEIGHFTHPKDIRMISYQKIYSSEHRRFYRNAI